MFLNIKQQAKKMFIFLFSSKQNGIKNLTKLAIEDVGGYQKEYFCILKWGEENSLLEWDWTEAKVGQDNQLYHKHEMYLSLKLKVMPSFLL